MSAISLPKIKSSSVFVVVQIIILQSSFNVVAYMYVVILSCYSSSLLPQRVYGNLSCFSVTSGADLGILIGGFFFRECISNNHLISIWKLGGPKAVVTLITQTTKWEVVEICASQKTFFFFLIFSSPNPLPPLLLMVPFCQWCVQTWKKMKKNVVSWLSQSQDLATDKE